MFSARKTQGLPHDRLQCPAEIRPKIAETRGIGYNTLTEDLQENVSFLSS